MIDRIDISVIMHSKEYKPKKKTFVDLDNQKIGVAIDWDNSRVGFFLYKKKKKFPTLESKLIPMQTDKDILSELLIDMISDYYEHVDKEPLSYYGTVELSIMSCHLWYHITAGTLKRVTEKEVIYY